VDEAERNVARQNLIDVPEMYKRLALDGIDRTQFRKQLREQLVLSRLRERDVNQKVRVSELEIDQYLRDQQRLQGALPAELNLSHVLLALPEDASAEQVAATQARAQRVIERARAGEDFAALARELSDAPDGKSGGQLGLRPAERYPTLFVEASRDMAAGGLAIVRSGAGLHVLKLVEKRQSGMPATTVEQTLGSHILLRVSPQLTEAQARERLSGFRDRILAGQAEFAALAREHSQDGSASQGGELGWVSPGQLVPEFEEVMNALAPGALSEPLASRFGVHLITVKQRRTAPLSLREQREIVRGMLREKKLDDAFAIWSQDLRARAYVEMRSPPG
jgi:peptidyl-prolyl cis-trans isomerase SurA